MPIHQLEREAYQRLLVLLDEALDQPEADHARWLETLDDADAPLKPYLARLLAQRDQSGKAARLEAGAAAMVPAEELAESTHQPGAVVAGYQLIRVLGQGGMGVVWLARKSANLPPVALKLAAATHMPRSTGERMAREAAILAALNHPHIARLLESGVSEEGVPFLAMEYVDGLALPAHCDVQGLTIEDRLRLFISVLEAVGAAHAALILHRDIKPANILVNKMGEVKLLDFGIAKLIDESGRAGSTRLTQLAGRVLTPDYASPEQIAGQSLTVASDVYSLGVMLFELVTGDRPYRLKRGTAAELEEAILTADTNRPSNSVRAAFAERYGATTSVLKRKLAGDLDTIILKALKKSPGERYHSVLDFRDDLDRHLRGLPVRARPDSFGYAASRFVRRNRFAVSAASAVALALLFGLIAALWQARIAAEEAARANAIKQFLTGLLERNSRLQTNAAAARSKTVREVLIESSEKINTAFSNDKLLREELSRTIGNLLVDVEEAKRGASLLEEAVRLMEAREATRLDLYFETLVALINAYRVGGRGSDALATREKALIAMNARGDKTSLTRAMVLGASLHHFAKDHDREMMLLEEALDIYRNHHADHPGHATTAFALANALRVRGYWKSATPLFAEAVSVFEKTGSKDVMLLAQAHFWRGYGESQMGRPAQALPHMERGIALAEQNSGAASQAVIFLRSLHARTLHRAGRRADAHAEFARLRGPAESRKQSPNDFNLALYQGEAHVAEGEPDKAIAVLSEYGNSLATHGNQFFPNAVSWVTTLALAHALRGDFVASDRTLAKMKEVTALYSADAPTLAAYRFDVSGIHLLRGETEAAVKVWHYGLFTGDVPFKVFFESGAQVWLRLAEAKLVEAGRAGGRSAELNAEALQYSDRGIAFISKFASLDAMPYLSAYAYTVHGRALKANGKVDDGNALLGRAIALMREHHAPGSVWLRQAEKALAR
ncbi:MAG: serine/threonine-protein kinase [Burkholderiales bacterium]|nr:serine/threonine-protein kinase [Burkholderiales bacterium]